MPISTLLDLPRQCAFSASPRIPAYLAAVASLGIPAYPHWNAFPDVAADIGRHAGQRGEPRTHAKFHLASLADAFHLRIDFRILGVDDRIAGNLWLGVRDTIDPTTRFTYPFIGNACCCSTCCAGGA